MDVRPDLQGGQERAHRVNVRVRRRRCGMGGVGEVER